MLPYLIIFLFAAILYFQNKGSQVSTSFYVFLLTLILFSGFRDMIGGYDVYIYGQVFEMPILMLQSFDGFEIGFRFYYLILKLISEDRYFMFFVTAALMLTLHFFAIKKYSPYINFSLFIYFCKFFLMSFVYLRQGLAMGIIWLSLVYITKRKPFHFFGLIFLAFLFHKSSIVFLPMYFIYNIKFKNVNMLLVALVTVLIAISPLSSVILGYLAESSGDERIEKYVSLSSGVNFFYLIEISLLIYILLKFRADFYKSTFGTLILNGLFLFILISAISLTNASFVRFTWYYFIFLILGLPMIYTIIKEQQMKSLFRNLVFVYYALVFFRLLIVYDDGDFMPYKSIFQDFNRNSQWEYMDDRR